MLTERLTAAGEQILAGLEETLLESEERVERTERSQREVCRQRRLLDAAMQPVVRLHRAGQSREQGWGGIHVPKGPHENMDSCGGPLQQAELNSTHIHLISFYW